MSARLPLENVWPTFERLVRLWYEAGAEKELRWYCAESEKYELAGLVALHFPQLELTFWRRDRTRVELVLVAKPH